MDVIKNEFSTTGIKEKCIFNDISNFHVSENDSVDIMHDLSEGIAAYVIGKVLQVLLSDKQLTLNEQLTLDIINNRIETFSCQDFEKPNKPTKLVYTVVTSEKTRFKDFFF